MKTKKNVFLHPNRNTTCKMKINKTSQSKVKFIPTAVWVFLVLGVSLYVFGFKEDTSLNVSKISIILAEVLVTSALVGFIINATCVHGFLRHYLNDFHGSDLINQTNTSSKLLISISKALNSYKN